MLIINKAVIFNIHYFIIHYLLFFKYYFFIKYYLEKYRLYFILGYLFSYLFIIIIGFNAMIRLRWVDELQLIFNFFKLFFLITFFKSIIFIIGLIEGHLSNYWIGFIYYHHLILYLFIGFSLFNDY